VLVPVFSSACGPAHFSWSRALSGPGLVALNWAELHLPWTSPQSVRGDFADTRGQGLSCPQPGLGGKEPCLWFCFPVLLLAYMKGNANLCRAVVRSGARLGVNNNQGVNIFNYQVATKQLLFRLLGEWLLPAPPGQTQSRRGSFRCPGDLGTPERTRGFPGPV